MRKYIRTKDKVCEITEWQCDLSGEMFLVKADNKFGNDKVFVEDIIAEADTIEELCDEFIDTGELKTANTGGWLYDEFDSKNKCLVYYTEDERRTIPLNEFDDLSKIYGAIWTDNGLIYVAKLNEKGELELL